MLVTDGAPSNFEEIFQRYNWPNIPVRVFTYLIGREVSDSKDVHWMACHNRGNWKLIWILLIILKTLLRLLHSCG